MLSNALVRASILPVSRSSAGAVLGRSLAGHKAKLQATQIAPRARVAPSSRRTLFVSARVAAEEAASTATKTRKTTTKKATTNSPKKAAKKAVKTTKPKRKAAPKKKAAPKLKSWEKLGPDGKLLPLPRATKPKRVNAFVLFFSRRVKALHDEAVAQGGGGKAVSVTAYARQASDEWNNLGEADKQAIVAEAEQANARYETDLERWRNSLTSEDIRRENAYITFSRKQGKKGGASGKLLRDPARPKRPMTAYFRYLVQYRKDNAADVAAMSVIETTRRAAQAFKNLSPDERAPYDSEATRALEQYRTEMNQWKKRNEAA